MILAAQYGVVDSDGRIANVFPPTADGLEVAWLYRDTLDLQGVVVIGVTGIRPVGRDGYYVDDPLEPVRPGTPDPVLGGKVRRL